jgi:phosphoribosyl 1,2-cyclic phosphodiesterase
LSVTFCPLASGSKGNAIFLGTPKGNVLFDAGISAKLLKERLATIGVALETIQAIIISHEHHDHIAGIKTLASRYSIPIIANYATAEAIVESIGECPPFTIFTTGEPFEFLDMEICPFSVQHDGVDPTAFTVHVGDSKIGICTDIGFVTGSVRHELRACHVLYVEANHEPSLVHASSRPEIYKRRVLSRTGHLSNEEAARLIGDVAHDGLQKVYLAHLSSECNTPETARRVVSEFLQQRGIHVEIDIAHQDLTSQKLVRLC